MNKTATNLRPLFVSAATIDMGLLIRKCVAVMVTLLFMGAGRQVAGQSCPPECSTCRDGNIGCIGAGLRAPPARLPANALMIDLTQNEIGDLWSDSFSDMPGVQSLRLTANRIQTINTMAFQPMPQLASLDLTGNQIVSIHRKGFEGLTRLRTLSLANNKLQHIHGVFRRTPALSSLNLGANELTSLDENDFKLLNQLRHLDLSNNHLTQIHGLTFKNLTMLRYLMLRNNPLAHLSEMTFESQMLQLIDFTSCRLQTVPRTIPASVTDFRLGGNRITEILEDDFRNITRLRLVTLDNNVITQVAFRAFDELEELAEVWLSNNDMVYIPRGLPDNLRKLYMDYNMVYDIENRLFSPGESQLEHLSLEMNKVHNIFPNAFHGLDKLKYVNLQGNLLSELQTHTFYNMSALETLQLSNNPIAIIQGEALKDLMNLTMLMMEYIHSDNFDMNTSFLEATPNLQNLNLMNSPLVAAKLMQQIDQQIIPIMPSVTHVNLQYSDLISLPFNIQLVFPNVQSVLLDGNPWHCDHRLLWLREWLQQPDIVFYSYDEPACETPFDVHGKKILTLPEEEFLSGEHLSNPRPNTHETPSDSNTDTTHGVLNLYPLGHVRTEKTSPQDASTEQKQLPTHADETSNVKNPVSQDPVVGRSQSRTQTVVSGQKGSDLAVPQTGIKDPVPMSSNAEETTKKSRRNRGKGNRGKGKRRRNRKKGHKKRSNRPAKKDRKNRKDRKRKRGKKTDDKTNCRIGKNGKPRCGRKKKNKSETIPTA